MAITTLKSRSTGVLFVGLLVASSGLSAVALAQVPPSEETGSYVVGISDVLGIVVWKNEDLSVTVPVRPDGRISVPLVGEVEAARRTPAELERTLTEAFEEFVTSPAVSVVVQEINSHRIFIMGEVNSSGAYDIIQPTRVLQALAMAGGLTDFAKKDKVILLRDVDGEQQRTTVSIKDIQAGKSLEDNILLRPGDTIIVP
jgi:polysaccharide export outer membrane protein